MKVYLVCKDGITLHPCDTLETANRLLEYSINESCGEPDEFERSRYSICPYFFFTMYEVAILEESFGNRKNCHSNGKKYE